MGLFAGSKAREERARAERVAEAIGPAMSRVGDLEIRAAQTYRAAVEAQRAADETGVPRLSERAQAAFRAVAAARDHSGKAEAWKSAQEDEPVAREISAFTGAAQKRFGEDGVRALLRAEHSDAKLQKEGVLVPEKHRAAVAEIGSTMAAIKAGRDATESQAQVERLSQRANQTTRLKPRSRP